MSDTGEQTAERLFKKRKVVRPRIRRDSESDQDTEEPGAAQHRQSTKSRRIGIGFSNAKPLPSPAAGVADAEDVQPEETTVSAVDAYSTRFARPTGQTGAKNQDKDKHMLAFIESKLGTQVADKHTNNHTNNPRTSTAEITAGSRSSDGTKTGISTISGSLQEVDLGPDATERNVQRTHVATQRLEGGQVMIEPGPTRQRKPRLGRDGKPYRPRKRRGSEDLARDALVESLLQENRIDVFAPANGASPATTQGPAHNGGIGEGTADEKMAEEFKRDYFEQMSERIRPPPKKPPVKGEDKSKGPKMGGTRNSRVAQNNQSEKK